MTLAELRDAGPAVLGLHLLTRTVQVAILLAGALAVRGALRAARDAWRDATPGGRAAAGVGAVFVAAIRAQVPSSPSDINLRSAEVFLGVFPDHWGRGLGFPTLFGAVMAPFGRWPGDLHALFEVNRALGVLTVLATAALAARALPWVGAALTAGLVLTVDPIHVRFAATDSQSVLEALCAVLALGVWLGPSRPGRDVDASALLAVSAVMRPEAALNALMVPLAAWLADPSWATRRGARRGALACLALAAVHVGGLLWVSTSDGPPPAALGEAPALWVYGPYALLPFHPTWGAPALAALFTAGLVALATSRRTAGVALLAIATSSYVASAGWSIAHGDILVLARHHVRATPWIALVVAAGASWIAAPARRAWLAPALAAGALATRPLDLAPYTLGDELRFLATHLPTLDPACDVEVFYPAQDTELAVSWELSEAMGLSLRWHRLGDPPLAPRDPPPAEGPCRVWYRSANCDVARDGAACSAFEADHVLTPIAEVSLPDRPWLDVLHARRDALRVGLYRVVGPAPTEATP